MLWLVHPVVLSVLGESLSAYLMGKSKQAHSSTYGVGLEQGGTAYYRQGKWKLTTVTRPYREEDMKLYDVETDPGERVDLSAKNPEKRLELLQAWREYQQAHGIRIAQP